MKRPPKKLWKKRKRPSSYQGGQGRKKAPGGIYLWFNSKLDRTRESENLVEAVSELQARYFKSQLPYSRRVLTWEIHREAALMLLHRMIWPISWLYFSAGEVHSKLRALMRSFGG